MSRLAPAEKVELASIPLAIALTLWLAPGREVRLDLGVLIGGSALLLLLQGFIRDLWLLREARRQKTAGSARAARCLCVESAVGLTGIGAGIGLAGFGLGGPIHLSAGGLAAAVGATVLAGFLLKDLVFEWSPWKIYREKNHAQVIFRWRP